MDTEVETRTCSVCGKPLPPADDPRMVVQGWYCCDEYYCSQKCLDASFEGTGETWEQHYSDDGDCYYTEWEDES
jgi:hypothetical protein